MMQEAGGDAICGKVQWQFCRQIQQIEEKSPKASASMQHLPTYLSAILVVNFGIVVLRLESNPVRCICFCLKWEVGRTGGHHRSVCVEGSSNMSGSDTSIYLTHTYGNIV